MITNIPMMLSSLAVSVSLLLGGLQAPQAQEPPPPNEPASGQAAPGARWPRLKERWRERGWPFAGDPMVRQGLVLAAVSVTGLRPAEVMEALEGGQSIQQVAEGAGETAEAVLEVYDETARHVYERWLASGSLPESLAQRRLEWYQEAGRQMIDLPGLRPPYPGLHQMHVALLLAGAQVGELDRFDLRDGLTNCQSLDEILAAKGHSGQEAVDAAMKRIDQRLERLAAAQKLTGAQRERWHTSLQAALAEMVKTPGLHLAGKQCSE